jgi:hypothetical protein
MENLEPLQQKAIDRINERQESKKILTWMNSNKVEAAKIMELSMAYGSCHNITTALSYKTSHNLYRNALKENRKLREEIKNLKDEKI